MQYLNRKSQVVAMLAFATRAMADTFVLRNNFEVEFDSESCAVVVRNGDNLVW